MFPLAGTQLDDLPSAGARGRLGWRFVTRTERGQIETPWRHSVELEAAFAVGTGHARGRAAVHESQHHRRVREAPPRRVSDDAGKHARVRRVTTNGVMSTLFNAKNDVSSGLGGGRTLWVKDDESLAYFGNTDRIRKWTPLNGLQTFASDFTELGCFCVEASGSLIVADRGAHHVYRVFADGSRTIIAGNGTTTGGGDGFAALQTGLYGPRGVWPVPTGGYLLLLHDGAQLWYVDGSNTMHLLINGVGGNGFVHSGDGQHFYAPDQSNLGEGRSVAMDFAGNILICESDYGFIRRIRFQPMN